MKLGLIWTMAVVASLSFTVKASEQASSNADELPIVQFDTKSDMNQPQVKEAKLPQEKPAQASNAKKKAKKNKKDQTVISDVTSDITIGLVAKKTKVNKTAEKVDEDDFGRLDREMEVLK